MLHRLTHSLRSSTVSSTLPVASKPPRQFSLSRLSDRRLNLPTLTRMSSSATVQSSRWSETMPKPADEMATFLCVIPDLPDSKRMSVRPQHLEEAAVGHANGWIVKAGATFSDDTRSKMTGSWFLLREESSDKAHARLSADIYVTGGAWDMSKATITPVAVAKH